MQKKPVCWQFSRFSEWSLKLETGKKSGLKVGTVCLKINGSKGKQGTSLETTASWSGLGKGSLVTTEEASSPEDYMNQVCGLQR